MSRLGKREILTKADEFAQALDAEDYERAKPLLSSACIYEISGRTIVGSNEIINSYKAHGDQATIDLDSIEYESAVELDQSGDAIVTFVDRIAHRGETLLHTSQQILQFGIDGLICHIRHIELPGERDALEEFSKLTGWRQDNNS